MASETLKDRLRTVLNTKRIAEQTRHDLVISHKEAVRLLTERKDAAAEIDRLIAELEEMRRLYADAVLDYGRKRGELREAREALEKIGRLSAGHEGNTDVDHLLYTLTTAIPALVARALAATPPDTESDDA